MGKIKILGLALIVACVGVVGLAGCTKVSQPYDLLISNAQKEFNIGDDFTLGNDFSVSLQFEANKTMTLNNQNTKVDEKKKIIQTVDYTVDFSNFDSSKGGKYYIFVKFNDHDNDPNNDVKRSYQVNVNLNENSWIAPLSVQNWHYGNFEITNLSKAVAKYLNPTVQYSYKKSNQTLYTNVNSANLASTLANLSEGEYTLVASCPQTKQYQKIETSVVFNVLPNLMPATVEVPSSAGSKAYSGERQLPDLQESEYYSISYGNNALTELGIYKIKLTPKTNWLWSDGTRVEKLIDFTITKGTNVWIDDDFDVISTVKNAFNEDVKGWYKGQTNISDVFKLPEVKFGTLAFKYKLSSQDDSQYRLATLQEILNLDSQYYTIKAFIPSTYNYDDIPPIVIDNIFISNGL